MVKGVCKGPTYATDSGYAWIVLILSFLSHTVHIGFTYAVVGNLTIAHKHLFGISLQESSIIGSTHITVLCVFGIISSILVKKLGCRICQIFGGVCLFLGIGLSSLSTESWHAFVLFSVVAGIGVSLTYTSSSSILALNFDRHKYLAFSTVMLGCYAGIIFWPIASQKLLDDFGYANAMKIMALPQLVHILTGFLYFESENTTAEISDYPHDVLDEHKVASKLSEVKADIEDSPQNRDRSTQTGKFEKTVLTPPPELLEDLAENGDNEKQEETITKPTLGSTDLRADFAILLTSGKIWCLLLNFLLWSANIVSFYALVNKLVVDRTGETEGEIAFGITIIGIVNIVACLGIICTSMLDYNRVVLQFICILLYGGCTISIAFITDKTHFYLLCGAWGLGNGGAMANLLAVIYEFCEVRLLTLLLGMALLAQGIGGFFGNYICSYVAEKIDPVDALILSGAFGVASSLCLLPPLIYDKVKRCRSRKANIKLYQIDRKPSRILMSTVEKPGVPE